MLVFRAALHRPTTLRIVTLQKLSRQVWPIGGSATTLDCRSQMSNGKQNPEPVTTKSAKSTRRLRASTPVSASQTTSHKEVTGSSSSLRAEQASAPLDGWIILLGLSLPTFVGILLTPPIPPTQSS